MTLYAMNVLKSENYRRSTSLTHLFMVWNSSKL